MRLSVVLSSSFGLLQISLHTVYYDDRTICESTIGEAETCANSSEEHLKRRMLMAALLAAGTLPAVSAWSADYPNRPITFIAPFAPGSTTDVAARILAQHMGKTLGQPAIIDNRVGAGGTIGMTATARAKPDGYTLVWTGMSVHVLAPLTMSGLPWDPITSFTPIGQVATVPLVMVVRADLPPKNLAELVAYAKARPDQLTHATLGPTTASSLGMTLFQQRAGISMREISYKARTQVYPDLIAGRLDFTLDNLANVIPLIQSGKVRALAVTTSKRMDVVPDVPTLAEALMPGFRLSSWVGLAGPAGMPPEIVSALSNALERALETPEYKQWRQSNGVQAPEAPEPKQFSALIDEQLKMWRRAVELSSASPAK